MNSKFILALLLFSITFCYPLIIKEKAISLPFTDTGEDGYYNLTLHRAKPLNGLSIKAWFAQEMVLQDKKLNAFILKSPVKTLRKKDRITHYAYRRYRTNKKQWHVVFYSVSYFADQLKQLTTMTLASVTTKDDIKLMNYAMQYAFYAGLLPKEMTIDLAALTKNVAVPITNARISSHFGYRTDPINKHKRMHGGVDFPAPRGTLVRSIHDGIISFIGQRGGYGNVVEVDHGNGLISRYAHLKRSRSYLKQKVFKGEIIAEVGTTGRSTGPHLHLEVLKNGQRENPVDYLSPIPTGLDVVTNF